MSNGESVGLLITATGSLYMYCNGRAVRRVATGLPVNGILWGVVDVHGKVTMVKSEMLSGE